VVEGVVEGVVEILSTTLGVVEILGGVVEGVVTEGVVYLEFTLQLIGSLI